jgi:hypothetical protein|tara:strand:+ start:317 stop:619 length:303 start_codon:yes stop_codon:yes gene_type:complete
MAEPRQLKELEEVFSDSAIVAVARKILEVVPTHYVGKGDLDNRESHITAKAGVSTDEEGAVADSNVTPSMILDTLTDEGFLHRDYMWGEPIYRREETDGT